MRGEFSKATDEQDLKRRISLLKSRPISIQEFVAGQSDVDVVTSRNIYGVPFDRTYLTRLEPISPDWFKEGTDDFKQDVKQGFVPVEKIRLGIDGFKAATPPLFGDGIREIYDAKPTVTFDDRIKETKYYQEYGNHPVLLALRYLRQVAMTYYRLYGTGYPDLQTLEALIPEPSRRQVKRIIRELIDNPKSLEPFLENAQFVRRLDRALGKAFRSYTNPTATKILFEKFGVDKAMESYGGKIANYHTLLYQKYRNPVDISHQLEQLGSHATDLVQPISEYWKTVGIPFEKGKPLSFFHGTRTMEAYRNIVLQGNVASVVGLAGPGVYATDPRSRKFSLDWGRNDFLVELKLRPDAKVVDVTKEPGKSAFELFKTNDQKMKFFFDGKPHTNTEKDIYSRFADFVGADLIRYEYGDVNAYVIKNGAAIQGQIGVTIPVKTNTQIRESIESAATDTERMELFFKHAEFDNSVLKNWPYFFRKYRSKALNDQDDPIVRLGPVRLGEFRDERKGFELLRFLEDPSLQHYPGIIDAAVELYKQNMEKVIHRAFESEHYDKEFVEKAFSLLPLLHLRERGIDFEFAKKYLTTAEGTLNALKTVRSTEALRTIPNLEKGLIEHLEDRILKARWLRKREPIDYYLENTAREKYEALSLVMHAMKNAYPIDELQLHLDNFSRFTTEARVELLQHLVTSLESRIYGSKYFEYKDLDQKRAQFDSLMTFLKGQKDLTPYRKLIVSLFLQRRQPSSSEPPRMVLWKHVDDPRILEILMNENLEGFKSYVGHLKYDYDSHEPRGLIWGLELAYRNGFIEEHLNKRFDSYSITPWYYGDDPKPKDITPELHGFLKTHRLSETAKERWDKVIEETILSHLVPSRESYKKYEESVKGFLAYRFNRLAELSYLTSLMSEDGRKGFRKRLSEYLYRAKTETTLSKDLTEKLSTLTQDRTFIVDFGLAGYSAGVLTPDLKERIASFLLTDETKRWVSERPGTAKTAIELLIKLGKRFSHSAFLDELRMIDSNQQGRSDFKLGLFEVCARKVYSWLAPTKKPQ